ncbi:MAG: hypothetical protein ABS76_01460 [Pelagibacterium sp. SCN 64-44]|nr:MAG: hypothetical protein ABS76_01460 [Pelagibacterium sp. SCN 64-44]
MKIDRRITNGLIWAGAAIVLGVPAVDLLSAQFLGEPGPQLATALPQAEAVEPVPAPAPAAPQSTPKPAPQSTPEPAPSPVAQPAAPAAPTGGVVESYLQSGRQLPSYISDAPASTPTATTTPTITPSAPTQPAPAAPAPAQPEPTEMAALPPAKVAPVPMPLSMRPRPVAVPLVVDSPLIVDAPAVVAPRPAGEVTAADLDDWETGPLSEFLQQRARERGGAASDYDPNGFYLDQGPNTRQRQRSWLVGPSDEVYFAD